MVLEEGLVVSTALKEVVLREVALVDQVASLARVVLMEVLKIVEVAQVV